MKTIELGLIKGRHEMPVTEYIFNDTIENVFDFNGMHEHIARTIEDTGAEALVVLVTGLTPVTAELIRVCLEKGVSLTLKHFDRDTNSYREQLIF